MKGHLTGWPFFVCILDHAGMEKNEIFDHLNAQLEGTSRFSIRELGLEVLPRLMPRLEMLGHTCVVCEEARQKGLLYVYDIKVLVQPDMTVKKQFELWADSTQKHLKSVHHVYAKGEILARHLLVGVVCGLFLGLLVPFFMGDKNYIGFVLLGWFLGALLGWVSGKIVEMKVSTTMRLY